LQTNANQTSYRFPSFESLLQNRCRAKRTVALAQEDEIQAKASIVKPTKLAHFFENAQLRKWEELSDLASLAASS